MDITRLESARKLIEIRLARRRELIKAKIQPQAKSPVGPRKPGADVSYSVGGLIIPRERRDGIPSYLPHLPNLKAKNLSFAARVLIAVRDKFKGDAPSVYTAARVTRQAYSLIISDETHTVSKRTAIRFAFALKLTLDEATQLLKSAGYAFSDALTEDCILQACLESDPPIWDFDTINALLKEYQVAYQY